MSWLYPECDYAVCKILVIIPRLPFNFFISTLQRPLRTVYLAYKQIIVKNPYTAYKFPRYKHTQTPLGISRHLLNTDSYCYHAVCGQPLWKLKREFSLEFTPFHVNDYNITILYSEWTDPEKKGSDVIPILRNVISILRSNVM